MSNKFVFNIYGAIKNKYRAIIDKIREKDRYKVLPVIFTAIILVFIVEALSQHSIWSGFTFVFRNPIMYLFNLLIYIFTLSFTMLFKKRGFMTSLVFFVWGGLAIGNFVLLFFRTTPLTGMDFYLLDSVIEIIPVYLNIFQIILIALCIPVIFVFLFVIWKKCKKKKRCIKVPLIMAAASAILMLSLYGLGLKAGSLSDNFSNLPDAYRNYGFAYCFSNSIFDRGIKEPDSYSPDEMERVIKKIEEKDGPGATPTPGQSGEQPGNPGEPEDNGQLPGRPDQKPNIVIVQLESFFDVNLLLDFQFSKNPVPNFTRLKQEGSSGYLRVPSLGAGTANTEFEILTGMNIGYFGAGEYPYKTILQTTTCESINYDLAELGYTSHAIHNNTGTFYDRKEVFQKLGFDSFSSIEYMNNVEYNPVGWAKDAILTSEIMKALEHAQEQKFVYAISVQPHGKYPDTAIEGDSHITVSADPEKRRKIEEGEEDFNGSGWNAAIYEQTGASGRGKTGNSGGENNKAGKINGEMEIAESYKNRFEYFASQLYETDQFIGALVQELADFDEPTVVIFFGDHLPALSLTEEDLINGDLFQTEYVMWSNFEMEPVRKDLTAYQLTAYIQERMNYEMGILTKYHQRFADEPNYQEELKLLQYDMLYGNRTVFEGVNPYIEKPLRMGVHEIEITGTQKKGEAMVIYGDHFTAWSVVCVGDEQKETIYLDEQTLIVPYEDLKGMTIHIAQITDTKAILSRSEEWLVE